MKKFISLLVCLAVLLSFAMIPANAASVKLNKKSVSLKVGKTFNLKLKGAKGKVTFKSSKKSVATVNSKGKITAKKVGKATVSAKYKNVTYKCKVTVNKTKAKQVVLSSKKVTINKGKTYTLKCTVKPSTTTNKKLKWVSSNTKVATVSSKGVVTAKKSGFATITVSTTDGTKLSASCEVKVVNVTLDSQLESNLLWLKNYILTYGEYNNAGYKALYGEKDDYFYTVSYLDDEDCFKFYWSEDSTEYNIFESIYFKLSVKGFDYCTVSEANVYNDGAYEEYYYTDIILETATYSPKGTIPQINVTSNTSTLSKDKIKDYVNTSLKLAMYHWDSLLYQETGALINDFGFTAFE